MHRGVPRGGPRQTCQIENAGLTRAREQESIGLPASRVDGIIESVLRVFRASAEKSVGSVCVVDVVDSRLEHGTPRGASEGGEDRTAQHQDQYGTGDGPGEIEPH